MHDDSHCTRRQFLESGLAAAAGFAASSCGMRKGPVSGIWQQQVPAAQAAAMALRDSGAAIVTTVPATGSVDIFDAWCGLTAQVKTYSYHEEVAFSLAHGASLAGVRSAAIMKSHGFAKAANSIIDSLSCGVEAGFVTIVTNDRHGRHSDTAFDLGPVIESFGLPCSRPPARLIYEEIEKAFLTSEQLKLPVAVLIESEDLEQMVVVAARKLPLTGPAAGRDIHRHLLCPQLAQYQQQVLKEKLSGGKWQAVARPGLPIIPAGVPEKWRTRVAAYEPFFAAFKQVRRAGDYVFGDTGVSSLFAFPPYDAIDACTYYGGSIPLAAGACLAGRKPVWAVSGDYAFVAAGHLGLIEAAQRRLPMKVVLLHNGIAATTGGQAIGADIFERIVSPYAEFMRRILNPSDVKEIASVLDAAPKDDRLQIIIVEYPAGA